MPHFQERLYNYESAPPQQIWENISAELDANEAVRRIHPFRKRSKVIYYGLTVAASLLIIFVSSLFFNKKQQQNAGANLQSDTQNLALANDADDSMNSQILASIIASKRNGSIQTADDDKKYITVVGPTGQPVKVSTKAATLIVSADNEFPPKPVWDKKITKWSEIMLSSTVSPTATNLLDIVQISSLQNEK